MKETVEKQRGRLLADLATARKALCEEIENLPADCQDVLCIGCWCVKDLLAHMVGWDVTNLEAIQEILHGQRPHFFQHYDKDWRGYNDMLVSTYRREPWELLLSDASDSHEQLMSYLRSLTADQVVNGKVKGETGRTVTVRNLLRAQAGDELEHAAQLREFFAQYTER